MSKCDWRSIDAINEAYDRKRDATPQYIRERALNNYYCCPREYTRYDVTYQVLDNQGEIIREEKSEKYDGNVIAGLIKFIYESGKEEVWQLYIYEMKESIHLDNGRDGYFCYMRWAYVPTDIVDRHICEEWEDGQ